MTGDNLPYGDAASGGNQLAGDELATDLADDVDATVENLVALLDVDDSIEQQTPFGQMSEADMLGMVRPMLWQWTASRESTAIEAIALLHRATDDLLDKHADRSRDELAEAALDRA